MKTADRLKSFFQSRNYTIIDQEERNLTFEDGDGIKYCVTITPDKAEVERNNVLRDILHSTSLTYRDCKVYLAIPKHLAAIIDSKIFEEQGIGLLTYGDKVIDEAIPPKPPRKSASDKEIPPYFLEEIQQLRIEYHQLKDMVQSLQSNIKNLSGEIESIKGVQPTKGFEITYDSKAPSQTFTNTQGTPSFMKDNPWLEVLARRGKEPQSYVS